MQGITAVLKGILSVSQSQEAIATQNNSKHLTSQDVKVCFVNPGRIYNQSALGKHCRDVFVLWVGVKVPVYLMVFALKRTRSGGDSFQKCEKLVTIEIVTIGTIRYQNERVNGTL